MPENNLLNLVCIEGPNDSEDRTIEKAIRGMESARKQEFSLHSVKGKDDPKMARTVNVRVKSFEIVQVLVSNRI